ncbi:pyruvate kinase-like [Lycorma delicatula]|uniref:pyruvate kinase-like n=1 Tax=Lycorma delicatula TaxID=130591 RepID=UPI003F5192BC
MASASSFSKYTTVLPWNEGDYERNTRLQMKAAFKENLLDHMAALDSNSEIGPQTLSKIICTLSPLNSSVESIENLLEAGLSTILLPMWAFSYDEKLIAMRNLREAVNIFSTKNDVVHPLSVGIDLRGPTVHTGRLFENKPVKVNEGTTLTLTTDPIWQENGTASKVFVDYPDLPSLVKCGTDIFIDCGLISLNVSHTSGEEIVCDVLKGSMLYNNRIVQVLEVPLSQKDLTDRDIEDIDFAMQMEMDYIFISGVRFESVIKEIRKIIAFKKGGILLVAKIQDKMAVINMEQIVQEADALVLVRNCLAVEVTKERTFIIQDNVISMCKMLGKPIFIQEGIIYKYYYDEREESIESELIDIADVFTTLQKGVDGFVMRDKYTLELNTKKLLKELLRICVLAEPSYWQSHFFNKLSTMAIPPVDPAHAISIAVIEAAMKAGASAILVCTASGASAKLLCRYLPRVPVIAITRYGRVARQLTLYRAAVPFQYIVPPVKEWQKDVDLRFQAGIDFGKRKGIIKAGDVLVLLNGWRPGAGFTNTMRMTYASQTDPWLHLPDFEFGFKEVDTVKCPANTECPFQSHY